MWLPDFALILAGISSPAESFRSAVNSSLAQDLILLDDILRRANWRSSAIFLRHYFRPVNPVPVLSGPSPVALGFLPTS